MALLAVAQAHAQSAQAIWRVVYVRPHSVSYEKLILKQVEDQQKVFILQL